MLNTRQGVVMLLFLTLFFGCGGCADKEKDTADTSEAK